MNEFAGPLNLSDADTSGIEPLPSGAYICSVFEAGWVEGGVRQDGALPAGTPMFKVQFKAISTQDGGEEVPHGDKTMKVGNRRFFQNYFPAPPDNYDKDKAAKLKGAFVRFLVAVGYEEEKVMKGKFSLDVEDLIGRECVVIAGQGGKNTAGDPTNDVKGVKAVGEAVAAKGLL